MFCIPKRLISQVLQNKNVSIIPTRIRTVSSPLRPRTSSSSFSINSSPVTTVSSLNASHTILSTVSLARNGRNYTSSSSSVLPIHYYASSSFSRSQSTITGMTTSSLPLPSASSSTTVSSPSSSSLSSISSMRRVVNLLCVDTFGTVSELRMPITQLKQESHLHMRELLIVEQPARGIQPRILPRRHCIVMTIGIVRAIIFTDRIYLFNSRSLPGVNEYAQALASHLVNQRISTSSEFGTSTSTNNINSLNNSNTNQGTASTNSSVFSSSSSSIATNTGTPLTMNVSSNNNNNNSSSGGSGGNSSTNITMDDKELTPFEIQVMEHVLLSQVLKAARRVTHLRRLLERQLARMVTVERDDGNLAALFPLANTVTHFELVTRGLGECIRDLLDDDRDMREACLTEKKRNIDAIRSEEEENWKLSTIESMDHDGEQNDIGGYSDHNSLNHHHNNNNTHSSSGSNSSHNSSILSDDSSRSVSKSRSATSAELLFNERPRLRNTDNDEDNNSMTLRLRSRSSSNRTGGNLSPLPSYLGSSSSGGRHGGRSNNTGMVLDKKENVSHRNNNNHVHHHNRSVIAAEKEEQDRVLDISSDALSQLELMLESVYHMAAETNMLLVEMGRTVRAKQDLLELQQSNYRNWILSATLRMTVLSVSFTTATFITSAFGQNLLTGLENTPGLFYLVTGCSGLVGYSIYRYIDHHTLNSSPTRPIGQRLEALTDFVYTMDAKVAAAQTVLMEAAARNTNNANASTDNNNVSAKGSSNAAASSIHNSNFATTDSDNNITNESFSLPQFLSSPRLLSHEFAPALASDTFTTAYGGTNSSLASNNSGIGDGTGNVTSGINTGNGSMETGPSSSSSSSTSLNSPLNDSTISSSTSGINNNLSSSSSTVHPRARRSIDAGANLSAMRNRYLTKTEFKVAYERLVGKPVTLQEIDILFDVFDQDSDGRLKLDEVLDMVAIRGSNTNSNINNILTSTTSGNRNGNNHNGGGGGSNGTNN